ncbi:MAG TPA: MFS transporter, partial [Anaerolineales bacterium]
QAGKTQLTQATFQWVVLASILPAALAVLILVIGARDVEATKTANSIVPTFRYTWNNLDRRVKAFILVIVLFTLGNSSDAFIILRSQERGLSVLQILGMLLTFNAIYTLLSSPAGALSDRIGRKGLILAGWTIYGLVYLCLAFAKTGFQVWLFFSLYGIYYALTEGTARAYIADLVSQDQRGGAYGLFHAAIGLASLPASLIAGILWQGIGPWAGFGPSAPFVFGAGMAILSVGLLVSWVK